MSVLARADAATLETASRGVLPRYSLLRGPEAGLVMVRGRIGGAGQSFNLGETSVVRCTVRSEAGYVGHSYCLGRQLQQAELAAAIDAGLQDEDCHATLYERIIVPLAAATADDQARVARRAAATQVQFFTMTTMRT